MCTVAIFRFCTVVSYFFPGILDSRFLVVYENMQNFVFGFFFWKFGGDAVVVQKKILTITKWSMAKFSLCMKLNLDMLMSIWNYQNK